MRSSGPRRQGFTLVEVMVAMAVVAVALPALLFSLIQQIDGTGYLRERTLASWVAANKLAELRLVVDQQQRVPTTIQNGEYRLAEQDWYWWIVPENTELPGFVRVEIKVALDPEGESEPLQVLTAFFAPEEGDGP